MKPTAWEAAGRDGREANPGSSTGMCVFGYAGIASSGRPRGLGRSLRSSQRPISNLACVARQLAGASLFRTQSLCASRTLASTTVNCRLVMLKPGFDNRRVVLSWLLTSVLVEELTAVTRSWLPDPSRASAILPGTKSRVPLSPFLVLSPISAQFGGRTIEVNCPTSVVSGGAGTLPPVLHRKSTSVTRLIEES